MAGRERTGVHAQRASDCARCQLHTPQGQCDGAHRAQCLRKIHIPPCCKQSIFSHLNSSTIVWFSMCNFSSVALFLCIAVPVHPTTYAPPNPRWGIVAEPHVFSQLCGNLGACPWADRSVSIQGVHLWKEAVVFQGPLNSCDVSFRIT